MQARAAVGLGSNLGDRETILRQAIESLATSPGVSLLSVSRNLETAPVGGPPDQGPFLNAALTLETTLSPEHLHELLNHIERQAGRRRVVRWGERTLDLDLLLFGECEIQTDTLTVPHPRMAFRRFVLDPLALIAPEWVHPTTGRAIADLRGNLDVRPLSIGLFGWDADCSAQLAQELPDFVLAKRLETLNPPTLESLQFLMATQQRSTVVAASPFCKPIPTQFLDGNDLTAAREELTAACLSVL
jgi:2-amino-4-hydroxy-6-hydroxymethyldihydropteridine diphosphokinase